jgi:Omp85 superfamily domain
MTTEFKSTRSPCACSGIWGAICTGLMLLALTARDASAQTNATAGASTNGMASIPATAGTNNAVATNSSSLFDPHDGWLDLSSFLDKAYGCLPVALPITEPAVGYGAAGGLMFINRGTNSDGTPQKPGLTMVGGGGTENGTWAVLGANTHSWFDEKLETQVVLAYAYVNLKFYGIGEGPLNNNPVPYTLQPLGTILEGRYRLGDSRWQAGLRYTFAGMRVSFAGSPLPAQISPAELETKVSGLAPVLIYDKRNNLFTPTQGRYFEAGVNVNSEVLGSSFNYEIVSAQLIQYVPLGSSLFFGIKGATKLSFDNTPFYALPFIDLRGVAKAEYIGQYMAEEEMELRWQLWKRFSLVGFTGLGGVWNNFDHFNSKEGVVTGGTGIRYELARRYGLHLGADVAFGPRDTAFYIQIGSAWFRP